jgi:hemoglobin/transferrin/lactoferrin receptor protein
MKNPLSVLWIICLISFLFLNPPDVYSQEKNKVDDLLNLSLENLLDMKVISASRHEQKIIDAPRSVSVITAKEIRERNYRTTAEALSELAGVHLQETNYGGGAVILRGLIGNQILIMVDGVRMNNAIYRLGPNQYLNAIDINQIERIEVVRGAGSVLYGSDALGGLVNIITKSKVQKSDDTDALIRAFTRYASADNGGMGRVELGKQLGSFNVYGGASIKKFNDLTGGANTGVQKLTGYSEWDADIKISYAPAENHTLVVGYQHVNQNDVPRSDVVVSGVDLKRVWNPELRDLLFLEYNFDNVTSFIDNLTTKLSYQTQSEDVFRIQSSSATTESENLDKVKSIGTLIQLSTSVGDRHRFTYGADLMFDNVTSTRTDRNMTSGVLTPKTGTYADGSEYSTFALFVQDEIQLTEQLYAQLGLRYNSVTIKADLQNSATGAFGINSKSSALVGSGSLMYHVSEGMNLILGVAQGFRAPNIDDATILGNTGSSFEVPNPNLNPEQLMSYELGMKVSKKDLSGSLFVYLSDIRDLITRVPGLYLGKSFLDLNNNGTKESNERSVLQRNNIGKARIYGIEWDGKYQVSDEFDVHANATWTQGEDVTANAPLTRIPPIEGTFGAKWRVDGKCWIEYYNLFATKQDRLSASDKIDTRIPVGGTPGYMTFNLRGGYDFDAYGRVTLGLENLTNQSYRYHASGIDSPGMNFVLGYDIAL